jgi:hypothetical protein
VQADGKLKMDFVTEIWDHHRALASKSVSSDMWRKLSPNDWRLQQAIGGAWAAKVAASSAPYASRFPAHCHPKIRRARTLGAGLCRPEWDDFVAHTPSSGQSRISPSASAEKRCAN